MSRVSRRNFLRLGAVATVGAVSYPVLKNLQTAVSVANPLDTYPNRDWEQVYRDQYAYDDSFTFICAPNDTHNCRLRAFTRNGVIQRIEQAYDVGRYADQLGNTATVQWLPRGCKKGYSFHRRVYGPYRLKFPMVRIGWKQWADDGFRDLTPENRDKHKFTSRGTGGFARITRDEAYDFVAGGLIRVAKLYSDDEGAERLAADGYQPEMMAEAGGAGARTMKLRGGMGLLGTIGKYSMYRMDHTLALLDVHVRGVGPDTARAGRSWSNYTWHGDRAPGHPFVHGLQTSESDLNDLSYSKLTIQVGKNLVENKMPESHFFSNVMEQGGKIVTMAPEYSAPASKSDYWLPVRPGLSDAAILLGIARILMEQNLYDADFVERFTDFPLLPRTDNLERLRAKDVFPGYRPGLDPGGPSFTGQKLTQEQYEKVGGDFVIFDEGTGAPRAITRDDVGQRMVDRGFKPKLSHRGAVRLVDGSEVEVLTLWEAYRDHLKDYDLDTVEEITGCPKHLVERLANDIATIKTRHTTHSGWAVVDWAVIWGSNFGDPHRRDTRLPHVGDREVHMNPQAAKDLGLEDGDYVYVDANPMDRPYPNYDPDDTSDPFVKVARLMLRVKFNPAHPYNVLMAKHGYWLATEKTVKARETRPDGRAVSADTGYQSSYRCGSHQSVTRDWAMPMHQTDTLFHKKKIAMAFMFGGEADNHAINTVPRETLLRITKAEPGGIGGKGVWAPATTGMSPGHEDDRMTRYLGGGFVS